MGLVPLTKVEVFAMVRAMLRLTSACSLLVGASVLAPGPTAAMAGDNGVTVPARTVCDADGRCFETGDPGYRDDAPPPRRRYDPDDDRPPPPPHRHRYDPDDDDRPPPPHRRFDPDDPDRPPPPRRFDPDDN